MNTRMHEMYQLLQECGEDISCACGCTSEEKDLGAADRVIRALTEVRRRIGLRQFRNIKRMAHVRPGRAAKVIAGRKMKRPVRRGAVHNRHR